MLGVNRKVCCCRLFRAVLVYKLILPIRYLFKKRISYLALLSVALCVFVVVIVMSVMTGLVADFKQRNHDFVGDCVVGTDSLVGFANYEDFMQELEQTDFVADVSPIIKNHALVSPRSSERSYGLDVVGIEPESYSRVTGFGKGLHYRKADVSKAFKPTYDSNLPGFVIGVDRWLRRDSNGDYHYGIAPLKTYLVISCFPLTPKGALAKAGMDVVNTKNFYFSDTSRSRLPRVDSSVIYLPFDEVQRLCGMDNPQKRVNYIHIKFKPGVELEAGRKKTASLWERFAENNKGATGVENVTVQSWKSFRRTFIAAMEKERTMVTIMFGLVGITTVFIVFVVFYMIISHKSKDVGILKSVGVSQRNIVSVFMGFAFLVGLLGSLVGLILGLIFLARINWIESWLFKHFGFQLWDRTVYAIDGIPNYVQFKVLGVIGLCAILACLIGAFIPSRQAAKLNPVETLQVNQL